MLADIDSFKHVNDTLGHDAGDAVLRSMADRLRDAATSAGFVARLGGDEFALLHVGPSSIEAVKDFADDLTRRLSEPLTIEGRSVTPGASIGIAIYPTQDPDPSALVKNADLALYAAKHSGVSRLIRCDISKGVGSFARTALRILFRMATSSSGCISD